MIALLLAFANGSNDNFKGVATLYGSGTTSFRKAIWFATVTTFLGSCTAVIAAQGLISTFSGKGLVPDSVVAAGSFSIAVSMAAGLTVLLATRFGFPVSTTHALTGALAGAGWLASESGVNLSKLGSAFFTPLVVGPVLSFFSTLVLYPIFHASRKGLQIERNSCVCVGEEVLPMQANTSGALALNVVNATTLSAGTTITCSERYSGQLLGIEAGKTIDAFHFLSAGIVSFARGLNDTPKIAALLIAGQFFSVPFAIVLVAIMIAIGGLVNAKKVAETMSHQVTSMNPGHGLTSNLVTSVLVLMASTWGLPVSTTHVSCGSLFGIGVLTKSANSKVIFQILLAWITTLPVAAFLGIFFFQFVKKIY